MATLQDLMGGGIPAGLLDPQQQQALQERAKSQGLLNLGFALLQSSQGQPGQGKPRLGQIIGQAGPAFAQGYRGAFDETLQNIVRGQQIQDMQKKREQQARSEAARQQFANMFAPTTPQAALAAPGRVGPTAARAGMIGQTPALDRSQLLSAILDPNMPPDVVERAKLAYESTAPAKEPEYITRLRTLQEEPELAKLEERIKAAGAPQTTLKVSNKLGEESGTALLTNLGKTREGLTEAETTLTTVRNMQSLLDQGLKTGLGRETILAFQKAGQLVNPDYKVKDIATAEAFIGAANQIILPQVKQLGVNPTDKDLVFIEKGSPTLSNSVDGNRLMLKAVELKFQRQKALAQFAADWQSQNAEALVAGPVSVIRAEAQYTKDLDAFMRSSPLWTTEVQALRSSYSQITSGGAPSMLQDSPFVTPSGPY